MPYLSAPVAAGSLIAGYAVAAATGSRPLGGVVLLAGGGLCMVMWWSRHGRRTALTLAATMLASFVGSHLLSQLTGAWPAVLVAGALAAGASWLLADSREPRVAAR